MVKKELLEFEIEKSIDDLSDNEVKSYLDILEQQIDVEHVLAVEQKQLNVFNYEKVDRLPIIISTRNDVSHETLGTIDWPSFPFSQMWNDYGAMLLNELRPVYESIKIKDDKVFTLRPNLSQLFVPSIFGVHASYQDNKLDSMPMVRSQLSLHHLNAININEIDFKKHWMINKYCIIIERWKELLSDFPRLSEVTHFSLPDLQGPFNLFFLLRGANAYSDVILEPNFTNDLMQKITKILIELTNYLSDIINYKGISYYWNYCYPGKIRNVDDNSIQLSDDLYEKWVLPFNQILAQQCSGGIHHYCGRGDHIIDHIMNIEGNRGLNFGNPEMQDWKSIYNKAEKHKIVLLYDEMIPSHIFRELNHGVIMKIYTTSIEEGKRVLNEYR